MSPTAHILEDSFLSTCTAEPCLLSSGSSLSSHSSSSGQLLVGNMMSTPYFSRGWVNPIEFVDDDKNDQETALQGTAAIADLSTIKASFTRLRKELDVQQLSSRSEPVCILSSIKPEDASSLSRTASLSASKKTLDKISAHGETKTAVTTGSLDGSAAGKRNRRSSSVPRPSHSASETRPPRPLSSMRQISKHMKITVPQPFAFTTSTSSTDTASVVPDRRRYCSNPAALPTNPITFKREPRLGISSSSSQDVGSLCERERRSEERCISPRAGFVPSFREIHLQDEARQARRIERIRSKRVGEREKEEHKLGRRVEQRGKERAHWEKERREREQERERGREEEQKREQEREELQILRERKATVFKANPVPEMYSSAAPHASSATSRTRARTQIRTQLN